MRVHYPIKIQIQDFQFAKKKKITQKRVSKQDLLAPARYIHHHQELFSNAMPSNSCQ
jgi:hypothetical protein